MKISKILGDRIMVANPSQTTTTNSGITLLNPAPINQFLTAKIVHVGTFFLDKDGKETHDYLKSGKYVKFRRGSGERYEQDGKEYLILHDCEVIFSGDKEQIKIQSSQACYTILHGERLLCLPCKEETKTEGGIELLPGADLLRAMVVVRGVSVIKENYLGINDNDFLIYRRGSGMSYQDENEHGDTVNYVILNREEILLAE